MRHGVALALLLSGTLAATPARADVSVHVNVGPPPPIVLTAPPPVVVVPAVPTVHYVPSVSVDLFSQASHWYYWHGGPWFVGPSYHGPWTYIAVAKVPRPVLAVPAKYYKIPRDRAKKFEGGGPPGHAKGRGKGVQ